MKQEIKEELIMKLANGIAETMAKAAVESGEVKAAKFKILAENSVAELRLDSVTHNSYLGITKILNEHYEAETKLLQQTYEKCKKFLDDNNLPYEEKREDTNEEVQNEQGDVQ